MHLRRFCRWFFPQVWLVDNLDVHFIFCVKLLYFHKMFNSNYDFKQIQNLRCLDFGDNEKISPKNFNLPSSTTFSHSVLKQIS